MDEVLHQIILPSSPPPEGITHFTVQEDESLYSIVDQLRSMYLATKCGTFDRECHRFYQLVRGQPVQDLFDRVSIVPFAIS
jgi:hypothetical protein